MKGYSREQRGVVMVRLIVGIFLMVIAFIELFLFIGGPENALVANVMTALACQKGERFTQVLGGYVYDSDGGRGQSFTFYCQDEAGNQRDVTGQGILIGVGGYLLPFLTGLFLVIVGPIAMSRKRVKTVMSTSIGFTPASTIVQTDPFGKPINTGDFQARTAGQPVQSATVVTLGGKQMNLADLPPETAQLVQQMLGKLGSLADAGHIVVPGDDLTDKLEQLKEARDKNLITQEEYDRARKAILDHLG
jgi:putative oligomerization/nucleic acid binding protein